MSKSQKDPEPSIKNVLDELLKVFPFPGLANLVKGLEDPLKCKDTQEMIEVLQRNLELLRSKEEEIVGRTSVDRSAAFGYVDNPSNFTKEQYEAIQKTKETIRAYEREVDFALETGKIEKVVIDGKKPITKKRPQKAKRFKARKKWLKM